MSEPVDYRQTVFLPKTAFPMKAGLAAREPAILAQWAADDLYGKLRAARAGAERFILHDGPPYANGDIHMGHAMNKVLKDIIVRSQSLLGKDAPYVPGWDCHGLPIEWKVEEQYRAKKLDKDQVDPILFRAECRAYAEKWVGVQRAQFERLGVMGDWDDPYLTMKYEAEAAIVAELLKFAETGQLYRGAKPVLWSPVEKTALAEAEVEYEDIVSTQIDVAFEIVESAVPELVGAHAVIWTTTPWTIPANQAIAYGPEIEYRLIHYKHQGEAARTILIADGLWPAVNERLHFMRAKDTDVPNSEEFLEFGKLIKGSELAGTIAHHPMHNLLRHPGEGRDHASSGVAEGSETPDQVRGDGEWERRLAFFARPRPFLAADYVTTDAGTGLVHMAPDFGEEDFLLAKANGIEPVFPVEDNGMFRADWAWMGGQGSVIAPKFNAPDGPVCSGLHEAGALLAASADFRHSYPHSWRSKAKLIYRCTPQWFISMGVATTALDKRRDAAVGTRSAANGATLRETALDAIERTRWVPERARNRIHAMVEGRPDWVISRQRAWGVPIALYVDRRSGDYLRDESVDARIVEAFEAGGADAWFTADHAALLGDRHDPADFDPVTDILDVWFDSGSTHAFVIEARYGEGVRADLYIEGSDQHRGWFQSSLLESCGTRGRAPYDAVLTHGFALDGQGRKMSKSQGNVVDPLKIIAESGADILRLWVASVDYFEDVRIGKEILSGTSDAYRKLRNTFRYLLGALDGFDERERVAHAEMPELERYVLHLLADLDAELREATGAFEFTRYVTALTTFANNDLSAFFFDVRKDSLYCDAAGDPKRRACRTVLDTLFHALVRYAAPILCFTAEEVWGTRFPDGGSVHLLTWPEIDPAWADEALWVRWQRLRTIRGATTAAIEPLRRDKYIGSSLEAEVTLTCYDPADAALLESVDFAEVAIVAKACTVAGGRDAAAELGHVSVLSTEDIAVEPLKTTYEKCGRCWRHLPEVTADGALCDRCEGVVHG